MAAPTTVDMRHTKLSAEDAALIAGELVKPSWASRNEGIHERISFDDTLWGFELAGGSYYKTPLRVVGVRPGSRAEQACIRKGDTVLRINDIDTSTLTLQQAHDIVLESGIHLRIAVTSPDDDEDAFYTYQDAIADEARLAEELRKAREAERIRRAIERANRSCNLPWPWVRRKIIIYRESNCFLVPSTYESKHKEKYPELPHVRYTDDISEMIRGTKVDPDSQKTAKDNENPKEAEPTTNGAVENGTKVDPQSQKSAAIQENIKEADPTTNSAVENGSKVDPQSQKSAADQESIKEDEPTNGVVDFDNPSNVMDEKEQNKIIDEILNSNEDEVVKNHPSDNEEPSLSNELDDREEDAQVTQNEANIEEEAEQVSTSVGDRLAEDAVESEKEIQEEKDESQYQEENESETNENNVPSLENEEVKPIAEEEEFIQSEGDIVDKEELDIDNVAGDKSEEDNVVDNIVGDGLDDSINER